MKQKLSNFVREQDLFGTAPKLLFKLKSVHKTKAGGFFSILLILFFVFQWYLQIV